MCPYHLNNTATLFCEKCHEYFCKSCNKKHKGHLTYTFDKYKKHLFGKLNYPKFSQFESEFKKITDENQKVFKQRSEYSSGNALYEEKYSNHYQDIINHNKNIFTLYELVYWNYNVLNSKSWNIFNAMNIINQIQLRRIIPFKEYCKQIVEVSLTNSYPEFIPKYIPNNHFRRIKHRTFKINSKEEIRKVLPLPKNSLLLISMDYLYFYDCKSEKTEPVDMNMKISKKYNSFSQSIDLLEKSNLLMIYGITKEKGGQYYFWDYTIPGNSFNKNSSLHLKIFSGYTEIEKDIIVGICNYFEDIPPQRIYYSKIYKYKLNRESCSYPQSQPSTCVKAELLFEYNSIDGLSDIIHYRDDIFYVYKSREYSNSIGIYSMTIKGQRLELNVKKQLNEDITEMEKLNDRHFCATFYKHFDIFEFESFNCVFTFGGFALYSHINNDSVFFGLYYNYSKGKGVAIDLNNDPLYSCVHWNFDFENIINYSCFKFSKDKIGGISNDNILNIISLE